MKNNIRFKPLGNEEIIFEEDDWIATRDNIVTAWIYKINYELNIYACRGYLSSGSFTGNVKLKELPTDMKEKLVEEVL